MWSPGNLLWFVGIVEYGEDATNQGRVKVRCLGIHPPPPLPDGSPPSSELEGKESTLRQNPDNVPTEDLPWAVMVNGTYGRVEAIPDDGEWVFGFFADGRDAQHPFVVGTIPGVNLDAPAGLGVEGSSGWTPASNDTIQNHGSPPRHPYASGENMENTQATLMLASARSWDGGTAGGAVGGWSEPQGVVPGNNKRDVVLATSHNGSVVAISEDYVIIEGPNGRVQVDGSGSILLKSLGGNVVSSGKHVNQGATGQINHTANEGYTITVQNGQMNISSAGDFNIDCANFNVTARAGVQINAANAFDVEAAASSLHARTGDINVSAASGQYKLYAESNIVAETAADIFVKGLATTITTEEFRHSVKGNYNLNIDGDVRVSSTGSLNLLTNDEARIGTGSGGMKISGNEVGLDTRIKMAEGEYVIPDPADPAEPTDERAVKPNFPEIPPLLPSAEKGGTGTEAPDISHGIFDDDPTTA